VKAANVQQETPAEIKAKAQAWFDRQIEIISKAHGDSWPAHRDWIEAHLKQEIRERLIARGWRPKR